MTMEPEDAQKIADAIRLLSEGGPDRPPAGLEGLAMMLRDGLSSVADAINNLADAMREQG
jgi:hypothetical protein